MANDIYGNYLPPSVLSSLLNSPRNPTPGQVMATDRSPSVGGLADVLASVKGFANQVKVPEVVPLLGGTGLGQLFMGDSPEFVNDFSYNPGSAIRGGNRATGGLGTYTLDKRVADAGLLGMDAAGIAKLLIAGGKSVTSPILERATRGSTSEGRREFLKGAGAASALAATPLAVKNVVGSGIPKAVDNTIAQAARKYKYNTFDEYLDSVNSRAYDEADIAAAENGLRGRAAEDFIDDSLDRWRYWELSNRDKRYAGAKSTFKESRGIYGGDIVEEFSPALKEEMKALKKQHGKNWMNVLVDSAQ